jgi:hypothetical protein
MRQVHLDLLEARRVALFIGGYFDRAPIIGQPEVMRCLFVTETHRLIAALVHTIQPLIVLMLIVLM